MPCRGRRGRCGSTAAVSSGGRSPRAAPADRALFAPLPAGAHHAAVALDVENRRAVARDEDVVVGRFTAVVGRRHAAAAIGIDRVRARILEPYDRAVVAACRVADDAALAVVDLVAGLRERGPLGGGVALRLEP